MGETTTFSGAIRVMPRVEEPFANKLNYFLSIRHMRRSVSALKKLYSSIEARMTHTLFGDGDFGEEGKWYLPEITGHLQFQIGSMLPEGLADHISINIPPVGVPNLYSGLTIVHSDIMSCSLLGWDGAEKPYSTTEWIMFVATILAQQGYILDGVIHANIEDGLRQYIIEVDKNHVRQYAIGQEPLNPINPVPNSTYDEEFIRLKNN